MMGRAEQKAREPSIALVIEDHPEVRSLAAAILEETDLEVAEAETAEEALRFLRKNAPEVAMIFTDVRLPGGVDGVDVARIAAQEWPWIKVLVTSGAMDYSPKGLPRTATFMPKPWRAFDVLVEAERVMAH
jgi:CheY-like chemotaxis protein